MSEHDEQTALFLWASSAYALQKWPQIERMFAVPNGGYRSKKTAGAMKMEGQKSGVPDILLPFSVGGFVGLIFEMKYQTNTCSQEQVGWLNYFNQQNWLVGVCYSYENAKVLIERYLSARIEEDEEIAYLNFINGKQSAKEKKELKFKLRLIDKNYE